LTSVQKKTEAILSGVISPHATKTVKAFIRDITFLVEWLQMQAVKHSHPIKIFPMLIQYFKLESSGLQKC